MKESHHDSSCNVATRLSHISNLSPTCIQKVMPLQQSFPAQLILTSRNHPVCEKAATHIAGSQLPAAYGTTPKHRVTPRLTRHKSRFQAASPAHQRQRGQWGVRTALRRASGRPQTAITAPSGCHQIGIRLYGASVNGYIAAAHFVVEDLTELDIGLNVSEHGRFLFGNPDLFFLGKNVCFFLVAGH